VNAKQLLVVLRFVGTFWCSP